MRNSINKKCVEELSLKINKLYENFDACKFNESIVPNLEPLGLFERLDLITYSLRTFLMDDYPRTLNILLKALENERGFIILSLSNYIAYFGIDHFDISMKALAVMTKNFSSEFAIRHFLIKYPKDSLEYLNIWVKDKDPEVRRLVSEGTRPRLPWGIRLQDFVKDPTPILEFLEILKDDEELYVRRSVANNLNDISKDNPDVVIEILRKWSIDKTKETDWVIKHSLRTLVKKGDTGALEILGFNTDPKIKIDNINFSKDVVLGGYQNFSFDLSSEIESTQKLVIDFVINHLKANGKKSPKVFKLKNIDLHGNKTITISKKHGIRPISTRKYYSGGHGLSIKINGKEFEFGNFNLSV